jgi:hypothetical protein
MIEYGLSVSLNTTPRPRTPIEDSDIESVEFNTVCWAPRKRQQLDDSVTMESQEEEEEEEEEEESISPRVLFTEEIPAIARRLDFDDDTTATIEISSFRTVSQSNTTTAEIEENDETIGDCSICYSSLPLRANHIFTLCGHLFCVRCLLKWWDTNTTCPLCRAEIFEPDEEVVSSPVSAEDNEEVWVHRELWNDRHIADQLDEREERAAAAAAATDHVLPLVAYDEDRTTDESDNDDNEQQAPRTRMNHYLFQDVEWDWATYSADADDTKISYLTPGEIFGFRENRQIAKTLFARMRFRDTLLRSSSLFMGRVWDGILIRKHNWHNFINTFTQLQSHHEDPDLRTVMYEFVIRRESLISPLYEVNIFGFMKDVAIIAVNAATDLPYDDDAWANRCEYAFVADVFTPTDFYIGQESVDNADSVNMMRSYGSYDITEGIINTHKLVIPFSQIRRLYRINSHEQSEA